MAFSVLETVLGLPRPICRTTSLVHFGITGGFLWRISRALAKRARRSSPVAAATSLHPLLSRHFLHFLAATLLAGHLATHLATHFAGLGHLFGHFLQWLVVFVFHGKSLWG